MTAVSHVLSFSEITGNRWRTYFEEQYMEKYRVRILIDRLDKPGTDTAEVHVGNVHVSEIKPIMDLAASLTPVFAKLDEKAK